MPNGVIWGGAVDGSNHVGAMVTCQAMTASPAGADWPVASRAVTSATTAASPRTTTRRDRRRVIARGSAAVGGVEPVETAQESRPHEIAAAAPRPARRLHLRVGALDDLLRHVDQLATARLGAHRDGAGHL